MEYSDHTDCWFVSFNIWISDQGERENRKLCVDSLFNSSDYISKTSGDAKSDGR